MSRYDTKTTNIFSPFDAVAAPWAKSFIGFDDLFGELQKIMKAQSTNYPPYNIKKLEENKYLIELAVAGFTEQDLEITLDGNRLEIKGNLNSEKDENKNFIHLGIANRFFTRSFKLSDNTVVMNAQLVNGLLKIWLESMVKASEIVKIPIQKP